MSERPHLTFMVIPAGGKEARTLQISYARLLWAGGAAVTVLLLLTLFVGSWWYLLVRARQAEILEERVAELVAREGQIESLVQTIEEMEVAYEQIRSLFGADGSAGEVWLPTPGRSTVVRGSVPGEEEIPRSWPLTEGGFITQNLLENARGDHPGIDIAIPAGSYIRAAGEGIVVEAGEDPIYGMYLVLEHGRGYRSLYAHASHLLIAKGDLVRLNEIIALSGSSGQSTAPHLHFEVLLDGEPIDPLSMVTQP
jgi:murein DD-endopeptidase MepM/ murein hydrolase activator NlpD